MDLKETEISSQQIFQGRILDLAVRTIKLPNGETATREVIKHKPASAVIAINDEQKMLLVKQWREPIKQITLEIPAGLVDSTDASPLDAMKRELNEEGGYRADYWEKVSEFYSSPGFCDEKMYLFYCDTLTKLTDKRALDAATGYNSANGRYVIIKHTVSGKTVYSFYAHMKSITSGIKKNKKVSKGQKIGVMGSTGSAASGAHLHFSVVNKLSSNGGYYGYATKFSGNKKTYGGKTFYNPLYIIKNGKLP